jgi:hypothetical protein
MKKIPAILFLTFLALPVFAQTSFRDQYRQIIYAVRPIEAVRKVETEKLRELANFSLNQERFLDQEALNMHDIILFSSLALYEINRRRLSPDEFSLFLQEQSEHLAPYVKNYDGENFNAYLQLETWIDLFKMNLLFDS